MLVKILALGSFLTLVATGCSTGGTGTTTDAGSAQDSGEDAGPMGCPTECVDIGIAIPPCVLGATCACPIGTGLPLPSYCQPSGGGSQELDAGPVFCCPPFDRGDAN